MFSYDANGNVLTSTNGAGDVASYKYDSKGNCTGITISREENGETLTFTSTYNYNAAGELTSSRDNSGKLCNYQYDKNGNMTSSTNEKGRITRYTYDDVGNLTKVTYPDATTETFTYDANGNNITATDRNGLTLTMEYDKLNRLVAKTYADGSKETYEYDAVGNVVATTSVTGAKTEYTYDVRNRNTAIKDAFGNVTAFAYDELSRLTAKKDALGNTTAFEYDNRGNIIKTTYADGSFVTAEYDARNRCTAQTDANGNRTSYEYDGADRLIKVTDATGASYGYTYDANGNLRKVTSANGNVTAYDYDAVGRVSRVTNAAGNFAAYEYDATGNVTLATDYSGVTTKYTYDNQDRLTKKVTGDETVTYKYNAKDQVTSVTDSNGTISYSYDEYGRLISVTDVMGNVLEYAYDSVGRLAAVTNVAGTTTYEYDIIDRLIKVTDAEGRTTTYEYDAVGNRKKLTYANGVSISYSYDNCHRLVEETVKDALGNTLLDYTYVLGKSGERLEIIESSGAYMVTNTYTYDALNRLTKEKISDGSGILTNEYEYDSESNRTSKKTQVISDISGFVDMESSEVKIVPGVTTYEYNELNQLLTEKTPEGSIIYTYDTNGNLISKQGSDRTTYMYDGNNRLHLVTIQEGNSVTTERYTYDYVGNRTSKTVNEEATEYYVVDVNSALAQVSAKVNLEGNVITSYVRGSDLVSMETADGLWYYIADGHGSIRALVNAEGVITDTYSYDAFGNTLKVTGTTKNDYRYTGEEYNETTGLYYLRARYMDPATGTFISMDSYPGSLNDPTSLHKYLYAHANPVMNTDPTGYMTMFGAIAGMMSDTISVISAAITLGKILALANVVCTVYDVGMQIKDAILGGGSILDIMIALAQGVVVGYAIEYICSSPLGLILRPVLVVMGVGSQFNQLMEAFESGDPVEITVRIIQMALTVYALFQQCFTGNTLVATEDGLKPIEDIKIGDYVWSEDVETGEQTLQKVLQVFVSQTNTLILVELSSGEVINTTEGHPFYTEEKGWCIASELQAGDNLKTQSGEVQKVVSVTIEKLDEPVKVYNLEVEEGHTYYVAGAGVLVYNKCVNDLIKEMQDKLKTNGKCDQFAQNLSNSLDDNVIPHKIIKVYSEAGIYSDKAGEIIGIGYHYGIQVDDIVYDNMTPRGIKLDEWLADLGLLMGIPDLDWNYVTKIGN